MPSPEIKLEQKGRRTRDANDAHATLQTLSALCIHDAGRSPVATHASDQCRV